MPQQKLTFPLGYERRFGMSAERRLHPHSRRDSRHKRSAVEGQEQPPMSVARRANVGEEQLERLLAQASGGNNTSLVAAVSLPSSPSM
jgi:hypothetical protein